MTDDGRENQPSPVEAEAHSEASSPLPDTTPEGHNGLSKSETASKGPSPVQSSSAHPNLRPRIKNHGAYLDVSTADSSRSSSSDSLVSAHLLPPDRLSNEPMFSQPASPSPSPGPQLTAASPPPKLTWRQKLVRAWLLGKGMLMVMAAQLFGASMNVMTRLLELDGPHGKGMHPFEVSHPSVDTALHVSVKILTRFYRSYSFACLQLQSAVSYTCGIPKFHNHLAPLAFEVFSSCAV